MVDVTEQRRTGIVMLAIAWVVILGLLSLFFIHYEDKQRNPNQSPQGKTLNGYNEVVLSENRQNHYIADGLINGKQVTFLIDTGATQVSLSRSLAKRLGLEQGPRGQAQTANGIVRTAQTRINTLELGTIKLKDVPASITFSDTGNEVLLGMSALKEIEFSHKAGKLTLRQAVSNKL